MGIVLKKPNYLLFFIAAMLFIVSIEDMLCPYNGYGWDYGYYQIIRFTICAAGAYYAYLAYQQNKKRWAWTLGIIAFLFNPFYKFCFETGTWQMFDFVAGVVFIVASFKIKKR